MKSSSFPYLLGNVIKSTHSAVRSFNRRKQPFQKDSAPTLPHLLQFPPLVVQLCGSHSYNTYWDKRTRHRSPAANTATTGSSLSKRVSSSKSKSQSPPKIKDKETMTGQKVADYSQGNDRVRDLLSKLTLEQKVRLSHFRLPHIILFIASS